jgi:hypothetical protein
MSPELIDAFRCAFPTRRPH